MLVSALLVLGVGIAVAYLVTPLVEKLAMRLGAVDHPNERKVHRNPVPNLGGLAIFLSFAAALLSQGIWQSFSSVEPILNPTRWFLGIFLGGIFILFLGLVDDFTELSPFIKFIGQLAAAVILVRFGVRIEFVGLPFSKGIIFLGSLGIFLTILWVVALINIVNFIDGLDGLAAGVSGIALLTLAFTAYQTGRLEAVLICLALAGASFGFLRHNFNPARIFMGDSGSQFLGFILGAITVQGMMKSVAAVALLVPLVVMGVPLFDGIFAIFRRFREGKPVTQADRGHIHHRLLDRGFSHRQTVILIYLWSILLSLVALSLIFTVATYKLAIFLGLGVLSIFLGSYSGLFDWLRKGD